MPSVEEIRARLESGRLNLAGDEDMRALLAAYDAVVKERDAARREVKRAKVVGARDVLLVVAHLFPSVIRLGDKEKSFIGRDHAIDEMEKRIAELEGQVRP